MGAAGCGSASGPEIPDATKVTLESIAIGGKAKLSWSLTTKLTAMATFSDGRTLDVSTGTTWTSDMSSVAKISPDGVVEGLAAGSTTIHGSYNGQEGTLSLQVTMPILAVSSYGASRIDFFPANATGEIAPTYSIPDVVPPGVTTLSTPRTLFVQGDELFVADASANAIDVFPITAMGNVAPTRQIKGALTGLVGVSHIFVTATEIYVAGGSDKISVFPKTGTGNIAPTRAFTSTSLSNTRGVLVVGNELFTSELGGSINVFPADAGAAVPPSLAPTRSLTGPSTLLNNPSGAIVVNGELFVGNTGGSINVYDPAASGDAPPWRRIAGADTKLSFTDQLAVLGNRVYSSNYGNSSVQVFELTATGDAMPIASISGPATHIANTLGIALIGVEQ